MPVSDEELQAAWEQQKQVQPPTLLGAGAKLPKGGRPVFTPERTTGLAEGQTGPPKPQGWEQQIQAYPGWTGTAARAFIPQTPTDVIGDVLGGAMFGPAEKPLAGAALKGGRAVISGLRNLPTLRKIGIGAGTEALADYLQGKSPLVGGLKGATQMAGGKVGEALGYRLAQRKFGRIAGQVDPPSMAEPITNAAPWLEKIIGKPAELWNHLDFHKLFQRKWGENKVGEEFRAGMAPILREARRLTNGTPRFQSNTLDILDPVTPPATGPTMRTPEEALNWIRRLRDGGWIKAQAQQKGGMAAADYREHRRNLVQELERYFNNISGGKLGAQYADVRNNMGRSMAFMRLFGAKDIVKNRGIDTNLLEDRYMNQKSLGLDLEDWLDPNEFDAVERAVFRGGDPTTPGMPGKSGGMHVYATAALKPHGYFKLGKMPTFAGVKAGELAGLAGALPTGRVMGGLQGEWIRRDPTAPQMPQPVMMPEDVEKQGAVPKGAELSPQILQQARQHPDLQGYSDEQIRRLYEMAQQGE